MEKDRKEIIVSVIMPVYNAEEFLRQSVDSVLSQTLKDIELVCVDDGSSDSSVAILEDYRNRDDRVKLICQENAGAGMARNKAMENAEGRYIAFMDADDRYPDDEVLEKLAAAAERHSVSIAGGSKLRETEDGIKPKKAQTFEKEEVIEYRDFQKDYDYQCYIFERKLLTDNGIVFPYYRRYQDPPFFIRAMLAAERFCAIPDATYIYKAYPAHISWNETKTVDLIHALTECLKISAENGLDKLHSRTVRRFEKDYRKIIINNCSRKVFEALLAAEKAIDGDHRLVIVDDILSGRAGKAYQDLEEELKKAKEEVKKTKKELSKIKNSRSYKIIRKIRKII